MKRLLALAAVMGLFYATMVGFSSANQKVDGNKPAVTAENEEYEDYTRDDLKTGLARAFFDALQNAENDIEQNEGDLNSNEYGEYTDRDGKKHSVFSEARRNILDADRALSRIKAENARALAKLRNPPRRVIPPKVIKPKVIVVPQEKAALLKEIEAQQQQVKLEQQKLELLKKELVTESAE